MGDIGDGLEFTELIGRSSLGSVGALRLSARTPRSQAELAGQIVHHRERLAACREAGDHHGAVQALTDLAGAYLALRGNQEGLDLAGAATREALAAVAEIQAAAEEDAAAIRAAAEKEAAGLRASTKRERDEILTAARQQANEALRQQPGIPVPAERETPRPAAHQPSTERTRWAPAALLERQVTSGWKEDIPSAGQPGAAELLRVLDAGLSAGLLERALTHRSFAYENGGLPTNERLEFLGDSVLGVVVTDALFRGYPDLPEGQLAKLRAAVVNMRALAGVARGLKLGSYVRLGRGEDGTGGRDKSSILADTLEAVIGAVYIERGLPEAAALVHRLFDPVIARSARLGAGLDWKTSLQELTASESLGVPEYHVDESGPDHQKSFRATVRVNGQVYGTGEGRSKKEAEQQAAETAWTSISTGEHPMDASPGGQTAKQAGEPGGQPADTQGAADTAAAGQADAGGAGPPAGRRGTREAPGNREAPGSRHTGAGSPPE